MQKEIIDSKDEIKEYINQRIDLSKLHLAEGFSRFFSVLITKMLILYLLFFIMLFLSIAASYLLGKYWGSFVYGLVTVAFFYVFVMVCFYLMRHKWVEKPIIQYFIQLFFHSFSDYNEKK